MHHRQFPLVVLVPLRGPLDDRRGAAHLPGHGALRRQGGAGLDVGVAAGRATRRASPEARRPPRAPRAQPRRLLGRGGALGGPPAPTAGAVLLRDRSGEAGLGSRHQVLHLPLGGLHDLPRRPGVPGAEHALVEAGCPGGGAGPQVEVRRLRKPDQWRHPLRHVCQRPRRGRGGAARRELPAARREAGTAAAGAGTAGRGEGLALDTEPVVLPLQLRDVLKNLPCQPLALLRRRLPIRQQLQRGGRVKHPLVRLLHGAQATHGHLGRRRRSHDAARADDGRVRNRPRRQLGGPVGRGRGGQERARQEVHHFAVFSSSGDLRRLPQEVWRIAVSAQLLCRHGEPRRRQG
mmetsp:Transcript_50129/g.144159  ORF Transcript_50129/g.144159 Transcript_50129/m.144159 type:complete len:348 (-) Transcript_50129:134-1177(-)